MTNQVRLGKQKWTVKISFSVAQDEGRKIITLLARSQLALGKTPVHCAKIFILRKMQVSFVYHNYSELLNFGALLQISPIWDFAVRFVIYGINQCWALSNHG
jgi:hypothetical protein